MLKKAASSATGLRSSPIASGSSPPSGGPSPQSRKESEAAQSLSSSTEEAAATPPAEKTASDEKMLAKRQNIVQEIIQTEQAYIEDLTIWIEVRPFRTNLSLRAAGIHETS